MIGPVTAHQRMAVETGAEPISTTSRSGRSSREMVSKQIGAGQRFSILANRFGRCQSVPNEVQPALGSTG